MTICFATSECVPYVKTGGLADVSGALPRALAGLGHTVLVFLPLYSSISTENFSLEQVPGIIDVPLMLGAKPASFSLWKGAMGPEGATAYFIDAPAYFHRGHPYTNDWDEDERFILFQHAVMISLQHLAVAPDVLHCNDWQTGLLPAFVRTIYAWDALFATTRTVMTIHNIGYQGRFSPDAERKAGLPYGSFAPMSPFEFHGSFCFLKAGIEFADVVTTVSPTYAQEIRTPAYGHGMEGVLAHRGAHLTGVLNGIDAEEWSPATDSHTIARYTSATIEGKRANRVALLAQMGLPAGEGPVIGIVSRFAEQKGFNLLMPVFERLMERDLRLVVLGSGDAHSEEFFTRAAHAWPGKVAVHIGFNNELAHRITAGADIFLMPSLYEPCGLNQMYSLAYGTVPVVRKTGGLADTVTDCAESADEGNGFTFVDATPEALITTLERACDVYEDHDAWRTIVLRGMAGDYSWAHSAKEYIRLYEHIPAHN